nr:TetR-like C-terminal domain-containing protein [Streptomyces niveus]
MLCRPGRWPTPRSSVSSTATRCPDISPPARCRAAGRTALLYRPACPGRRLAACRAPVPRQRFSVGRFRPRTPRPGSCGLPFPHLPPAVVALTLRIWGHLHGLISLEVHGHLHARTTRLDKLYDDDVTQLLRSLNLERHPAASGGPDGRKAGATRPWQRPDDFAQPQDTCSRERSGGSGTS